MPGQKYIFKITSLRIQRLKFYRQINIHASYNLKHVSQPTVVLSGMNFSGSMGVDNAQLFKVRTCIIQHTYTVVYCRCDKIKYLLVISISQETD